MSDLSPKPAAGVSRRTVARATAAAGLAVLFGAASGTARAGTATRLGPRTLDVSVPSAALGRSAPVRLILPSDFGTRPERTYPVLYLLHGAHDDYTSWTRETDIEAFTEGRGLIVAMPDSKPHRHPHCLARRPRLRDLPGQGGRRRCSPGTTGPPVHGRSPGSPPAATARWPTRPATPARSRPRPPTAASSTPPPPVFPPSWTPSWPGRTCLPDPCGVIRCSTS